MTKLTINLPRIVSAEDYHDFSDYEQLLRSFSGEKVYVTEVGYNNGMYFGYMFLGELNLEEIQVAANKLADELGIVLNPDFDDDVSEIVEWADYDPDC